MLKSYLKRLFTSPAFWIGAAAFGIIMLFSPLYQDNDTHSYKTIIYSITNISPETLYSDTRYSFESALKWSQSSWATMFAPVFVSVAAVNIFIDERECGFKRLVIFRSGKTRYILNNFLFFAIAGGLICMLGEIIFTSFVYYELPNYNEYDGMNMAMFCRENTVCGFLYSHFGILGILLTNALQGFIFGVIMIMPSFFLCSFVRNKYLAICIPFFIKYGLNGISTFLMSRYMSTFDETTYNASIFINPDNILSCLNDSESGRKICIIYLTVIVITVMMFGLITKRQVDKGG